MARRETRGNNMTEALTCKQALEAIQALIQGEWDNEQLLKAGVLSTDIRENIRVILHITEKPI
jgi:hypothetical protein